MGLPPIAPTFSIDQTKIIPDQTTVSDLLKDGFDIYIGKKPKMGIKYTELMGEFCKYTEDRSVVVKKGLSMNNTALEYSPYLLVKDGVVLCSAGLYGSEKKDTVLEDCKIVHLKFNEDSIQAVRQKKIQCTFNGIDIFAPLNSKEMAKRFGKKIWLFPSENSVDTNGHYGEIECFICFGMNMMYRLILMKKIGHLVSHCQQTLQGISKFLGNKNL